MSISWDMTIHERTQHIIVLLKHLYINIIYPLMDIVIFHTL